jgi:hypothetical protein
MASVASGHPVMPAVQTCRNIATANASTTTGNPGVGTGSAQNGTYPEQFGTAKVNAIAGRALHSLPALFGTSRKRMIPPAAARL